MNLLLWAHIASGLIAVIAGFVAAGARKGGRLHAQAGSLFVGSMLFLGTSAAILEPFRMPEPGSPVGPLLVCYFVATSWVTARRSPASLQVTVTRDASEGVIVARIVANRSGRATGSAPSGGSDVPLSNCEPQPLAASVKMSESAVGKREGCRSTMTLPFATGCRWNRVVDC